MLNSVADLLDWSTTFNEDTGSSRGKLKEHGQVQEVAGCEYDW